ncbi:MAG TPA: (2Fe-2S)-binding protein [Steroidobacteraceae bacterium]|jgi:xanthine dehydrogenase YagT iron-sulfur-binding subunit|nr:(2Fe-2S)-binding protein [Steroidobacteraceae bacterium]
MHADDLVNRRRFLLSAGAAGIAAPAFAAAAALAAPIPTAGGPGAALPVVLTVNGQTRSLSLDPRTTLLDALRDHLRLTGSKKGCDHGQCGACTVLVGGRRVLACLSLAVGVRDPVTTIEGLAAADGTLHPMQQAFIDEDAFQCGFCTPGQIMSAVACVHEGHAADDAQIREYMSGNLCRCAAYPHIVAAIKLARSQMPLASSAG